VIRLTPILLTAALAGCTAPALLDGVPPLPGTEPPPAVIPAQVAPFLPPGAPPNVVFQDNAGCYLYSIEVTNPPSGFPVRDAAGRQVCEGQPVTYAVPAAPGAAPAALPSATPLAPVPQPPPPAAVPLAPTTPIGGVAGPVMNGLTGEVVDPVTGGNLIDGTPISQIPAPAPLPVPLPTPVE
jgi:hypothetical protein